MKTTKNWRICLLGLCALGLLLWAVYVWKSEDNKRSMVPGNETVVTKEVTKEEAVRLVSQIHENMTFGEISKILSLSTDDTPRKLEHGGIWYLVPLGKYVVQLRFEYPAKSYATNRTSPDSRLNLAPVLQLVGNQ